MTPEVFLHIDELVLHGFAPADRHRIADAVEREIGRLLAGGGAPESWSGDDPVRIESLNAGTFEVAPGSRPDRIGGQIAQAVYGSLDVGSGP